MRTETLIETDSPTTYAKKKGPTPLLRGDEVELSDETASWPDEIEVEVSRNPGGALPRQDAWMVEVRDTDGNQIVQEECNCSFINTDCKWGGLGCIFVCIIIGIPCPKCWICAILG